MTTERLAKAVDRLLDEALKALEERDWRTVVLRSQIALTLDPENEEARRLSALAPLISNEAQPREQNSPVPSVTPGDAPLPAAMGSEAVPGSVASVARHVSELIPLPVIAMKVASATDDETVSIDEVARLIATDPALTAKLLRIANSAYYARPQKAATIREAIVLLGEREIRALTLTTCLLDAIPKTSVLDLGDFWRFSITVAVFADLLAHSEDSKSGDAFTAGIVHNIGLLALDLYQPGALRRVAALEMPGKLRLHDREKVVFGFTDAELGAELASRWRFSAPIITAIASHGMRPNELPDPTQLASYVMRARMFTRFRGLSDGLETSLLRAPTDEWLRPPLSIFVDKMGGLDGVVRRVNAFLDASSTSC